MSIACQLTVLMAVHNGGGYLREAVESILHQTYTDFRFLIVDDASTDDTRAVVRSYQDNRIELHCLDQNVGQTAALNIGLNLASTPWIARMDADDYSDPKRLETQMQELEADPSIDCIGTFAWTFWDDPLVMEELETRPLTHVEIKRELLSASPLIHGSIVVSRSALKDIGGYNDRYRYSAEVEMYDRLLEKYSSANIPIPLLGIRQHYGQGSSTDVAFGENIEICSRRLRNNIYSPVESSIARANLSRWHIVRGVHAGAQWNLVKLLSDFSRGFVVSPRTFPWCLTRVIAMRMLGSQNYTKLKRVLRITTHTPLTG